MTAIARVNRLPPSKVEVTGCGDCPLRAAVEGVEGDELSECGHPEISARAVQHDAEEPADFCPLLRAPLLLVALAKEGT
jgi:hypothetical protein